MIVKSRVYAAPAGRELSLDVFEPAEESSERTAVLMLHGGGWRLGDRTATHVRARELARHGFTALPVEYRLLGEVTWPAPLEDVLAAAAWTREHAGELGIDPERVAVEGFSAGGHLALLAAAEGAVDAVVAYYPPPGFTHGPDARNISSESIDPSVTPAQAPPDGRIPSARLLGRDATEDEAREISPLDRIGPSFPPTMLAHGTKDSMVPFAGTIGLHNALVQAGVEADLHLYSGQDHEFDLAPPFNSTLQQEVALFLRRTVSAREEMAAASIDFLAMVRAAS